MLLAVDVGNTNTVFGLCEPRPGPIAVGWRAATRRDRMPDEWHALLASFFANATPARSLADVDAVVVASVVPVVTRWLTAMTRDQLGLEPVVIGPGLNLGFQILTDNPREVGADRLANVAAAFDRYGGPAIVVDVGTATKFEVVSPTGDYLGGAIAPGLVISLDALATGAARLFPIELKLPARAIGTNTISSMQSGAVLGYLAMIEGMIDRIRRELGAEAPVVLTGGYAGIFAGASPLIARHDPDLTIHGLRVIFERVTGGR